MKKRRWTTAWLPGAAALGLLLAFAPCAAAADLNLLLITIDTLRPDRLSCYSPLYCDSPKIDALAAQGTIFERAFAHDPTTLPSHTNILLGLTSPTHGVNENGLSVIPKDFATIAETLKAEGYATGAFVSAFPLDSRFGLGHGFDVYDDHYPAQPGLGEDYAERKADKTVEAALGWLSLQKKKWFCWVHVWDPHVPYSPPAPYSKMYARDLYSGEAAFIDEALGRLFAAGNKDGWLGRTLILLTADHGESLGEHGEQTHSYFAYNSTIWVPLIVAGPGVKPGRVKDFVSHVDIYPTVCDLLGADKPKNLQGRSLEPLLKGKTRAPAPIYFEALEANLNNGWAPLSGIIDGGKKFIDLPIPELYDLEKDFDEKTNLAGATDLSPFRKALDAFKKTAAAAAPPAPDKRAVDRETRDRLRSLGYLVSPVTQSKKSYGREDDLKVLLPLRQKLDEGIRLLKDGKPEDSARLLEDVIRTRPDFGAAYDFIYQAYVALGRVEEGLVFLERGYKANPGNYQCVTRYGLALVKQERYKAAVPVLERALGLFDRDAEVWNSIGLAAWRLGDLEAALKDFNQALALDPNDAIYNDNLGSLRVVMAMKTKNQDALEQAVARFNTAIARDPRLASAYNGRAGAYSLLGKKDEAIADWEKAVALNPNFDFAIYNLAFAQEEKGNKKRALELAQKYLALRGSALSEPERFEIEALIERCKK
jgi:arylsulfatase A-like enzyme/Flp pilus assembly protein TadD